MLARVARWCIQIFKYFPWYGFPPCNICSSYYGMGFVTTVVYSVLASTRVFHLCDYRHFVAYMLVWSAYIDFYKACIDD